MKSLIEVNHLSFSYEGLIKNHSPQILDDINFSLQAQESLGIIGPNGGGKSTLLKIITGILPFSSGSIKIENNEYTRLVQSNLIDYIPQEVTFNDVFPLTIHDYLELYYHFSKNKKIKISQAVSKVGLESMLYRNISQLSGGEKQRVLLAKTILSSSKLLVLDEPTKGLDSKGQDELMGILKWFRSEMKMGIIIVDHNITQLIGDCDHILCLNKTHHWHDHKNLITKNVLQSIYQCELEHLLIHEKFPGNSHCHQSSKEKSLSQDNSVKNKIEMKK